MPPSDSKPKVPTPGKPPIKVQPPAQTQTQEVKGGQQEAAQAQAQAPQKAEQGQAAAQPATHAPVLKDEALSPSSIPGVSDSERSAPDEPLSEAELEGLALTAKLNAGMQNVFAQEEFSARMGVFDEANRVESIPPDSVCTWATPEWVDHGMHLNWLLTKGGHRMVHPREVSKHRDGRGIFIPGRFEEKGDRVEQNGSVLCIAKRSYTEAHREAAYQESVLRREGSQQNFQAQADELDPRGGRVERHSRKVDMGRYSPMQEG